MNNNNNNNDYNNNNNNNFKETYFVCVRRAAGGLCGGGQPGLGPPPSGNRWEETSVLSFFRPSFVSSPCSAAIVQGRCRLLLVPTSPHARFLRSLFCLLLTAFILTLFIRKIFYEEAVNTFSSLPPPPPSSCS
ncbi:unnamed protein product [Boreogadus saida]